jgi:type I restriction enzyme S subunit
MKPGYKQTEVGVIPEGWEVKAIADLVEPTSPICYGVVQVGQYIESGVPIVAIKFVKEIAHAPLHRTARSLEKPYARSRPKGGDVLISIKGTIGRVGIVPHGFEGNISRELARLRISEEICSEYVAHQLESDATQDRIMRAVVGTTRLEFSIATLRQFQLPIPPTLPEQRAIATALSDVDGLLGALDRLIAKKRDLKQAAMQQLLTDQTRLPGFHGEWEVKRLGELFNFSGGYSASRDQLSAEGHCYLHYGYIHGSTKTCIDADTDFQDIPKLDIPLKRVSSGSLLDDGDVVFVDASEDDAGTSKHVVVVNKDKKPVISCLHTIVAKSKTDELAHEYRRYCFQTPAIRQQFLFYFVGAKVSGISKSNIPKLTLSFPSVPEQTAIASVLTEMDGELAVLEQRQENNRALKQAMMHSLLSGRTRLV